MPDHPYGWLSLLPPLIAVVLAIATRRVVFSLFCGIFAGALVTTGGDIFPAIHDTFEIHLWKTLTDEGKLRVFSFTILMGALVGVIDHSGGMTGLVNSLSRFARTRRSGQLTTWFLGLLVFFDDYANTMLIGNTLRPVCDRLKISREKLAYVVDSTAAPVAGLAIVSTWIAFELDVVRDGIENTGAGLDWNPFSIFLASIPYRFYVLTALVMVPIVAISRRDFGPMLAAERRAFSATNESLSVSRSEAVEKKPARAINAILPIALTLIVVLAIISRTGNAAFAADHPGVSPNLSDLFGSGDSSIALMYGGLVGFATAASLAWIQRLLSSSEILNAAGAGVKIVMTAVAILWMASTMSRMTGNKSYKGDTTQTSYEHKDHRLYTGDFLKEVIVPGEGEDSDASKLTSTRLLPTTVFLLAAFIAFCTGTSFGTMGILVPMVVPVAYSLLSGPDGLSPQHPILLCSIGGVLAGAVFGDHCSPISDTTVLSSQSSSCDHIAHVWTQMPYAVVAALVAILLGTLPIGWGVSVWILLPLQFIALIGIVFCIGSVADEPS